MHPAGMNAFRKSRRKAVVRNLIAELDPLNDAFRHHVLFGEEDGERGGHAFASTRIGKTVFPERWSEAENFDAIGRIIANPDKTWDMGSKLVLRGMSDHVEIEVVLVRSRRGYRLRTAFPVFGLGVYFNSLNGRIERHLDPEEGEK